MCYDPIEDNIYMTRDVAFHETVPYFSHEGSHQREKHIEVNSHNESLELINNLDLVEPIGNEMNSDDLELGVTDTGDTDTLNNGD